jgi:hypothetical protein
MKRAVVDDTGRSWGIALHPADEQNDETDEEMVLRFVPDSDADAEHEIRIVGPILEDLSALPKRDMKLALEAAQNELGFLFLDRDDRLWWVQTPDEDQIGEGVALTFLRDTDELHHPGPLPGPADELTEDELQELLDECLGKVMG